MPRPALEVADIFRAHGPAWRQAQHGHLSLGQLKVMSAIEQCRSAALGGHVLRCEACEQTADRLQLLPQPALPEVPGRAAQRWLEARQADLLPVDYYHVVFTLPAPIGAIAYYNKAVIYGLLFEVAAETLRTIAADPEASGGADRRDPGAAYLGLGADPPSPCARHRSRRRSRSPTVTRWVACKPGFFLPVRVLSRLFRRRFLEELGHGHRSGQLQFFGEYAALAEARGLRRLARRRCASANGSSMPSAPSPGRRRCSPICRATPTGWRSPTSA